MDVAVVIESSSIRESSEGGGDLPARRRVTPETRAGLTYMYLAEEGVEVTTTADCEWRAQSLTHTHWLACMQAPDW